MSELSKFAQYNKLADQLIEKVSKDDLAECEIKPEGAKRKIGF